MPAIDGLVKKLKTAQRAEKKALHLLKVSEHETGRLRDDLRVKSETVAELESSISILRNNLKPVVSQTGNVTRLKP